MTIPHLFMCPISLDLFKDPVTLCTGQTYDRSSIEKWLAAGNFTCPVTMQKLHDLSMVPNHTLRHLIDQWLQMGPRFDPQYLAMIDSLASLKHILESPEATLETRLQALAQVRALSEESSSGSSCLIQLGFLPSSLELLFGNVQLDFSKEYVYFVEQMLGFVKRLLSLGEYESLNILKDEHKLEAFKVVFAHGNNAVKKGMCNLIEAVSFCLETRELCAMIGKKSEIIGSLVLLLHQTNEASEAAVKAVTALCSLDSTRENLVQEGAVKGLITLICNAERHETNLAPRAMSAIERLLGLERAKMALINDPNGVNALVKMVFRVSDHEGSDSAVKALMILCSDSLQAREEAICAGVLTQLLLLLQSQCSGRTKTKARMLLKLLRSKWDEEPKHS